MKLELEPYKKAEGSTAKAILSALPFTMNKRANLIHRPRKAALHHLKLKDRRPHLSIEQWCGNTFTGGEDKLEFVDDIPESMIVCRVCEERAVEHGRPTSEELLGRPVRIGKARDYMKPLIPKED